MRDCQQITFVMLNGFCPLSNTTLPPHPIPYPSVLNGQYQDGQYTKQNQMKNTCPFYILFQVLKVLLKTEPEKFVRQSHQVFYLLLFLLAFTSADIIFHKCLELFSIKKKKKIFFTNFPFLMDSIKSPHSFDDQNRLRVRKAFCRCSLRDQVLV